MKALTSFHWLKLANSPSSASAAFFFGLAFCLVALLLALLLDAAVVDSAWTATGFRKARESANKPSREEGKPKRKLCFIDMDRHKFMEIQENQCFIAPLLVSWLTGKSASIHERLGGPCHARLEDVH